MSESERPAVLTDDGADIDAGTIAEVPPERLSPHPKNREIYGDTGSVDDLAAEFVDSVAEKGVLEPLVVTDDDKIISGHRRWLAAKAAGEVGVPVRRVDFDTDLAEREALIEFNRQREKTPGQLVNEFEEMLEIEKKKAKKRKEDATGHREKFHEGESGRAKDKAAEKVNADVSGRTLEKGKKVKDKAESDDEPDEVQEAAQEAWGGLQSGEESFSSAHQQVKDAEDDAGEADKDDGSDIDQFTSQQTDEWSSPRGLVEPLADAVGGFDLDPCSGAEQSPFAEETYTEADDGLAQDWHGTVWVNPPYSEMEDWTSKAIKAAGSDAVDAVYYLCKGDTSTDWWQACAFETTVICAIHHRLQFGDGDNSAPFASHIMVLGDPSHEAVFELEEHGTLLTTGRPA